MNLHIPASRRPRVAPSLLRPLALSLLLLLLLPTIVLAQTDGLTLKLSRDFGYGGFSGDIQGTFSFRVEGPDDLALVQFYIDDQLIGEDSEAPWRFQFKTDNFALGIHELHAVGRTAAGAELTSNTFKREFVTAGQGNGAALKIVIPIIAISLLIPLFMYLRDRRLGVKRKGYGVWGGAVCSKCGKPFARHLWAPNLGAGKFDRCPHCGKWSVVRVASAAMLTAAEALLDEGGENEEAGEPVMTKEERLRKRLDASKFDE